MKLLGIYCTLVTAGLLVLGCDSGTEEPIDTTVVVVHAAPGYETLDFLRVERVEASLPFRGSTTLDFDADTYTFNIEISLPGANAPLRIRSFSADITANRDHIIVLAQVGSVIEPLVSSKEEFDRSSAESEFLIIHAAAGVAAFDVYVETEGTDPASSTPRGSVGFETELAPVTIAPGGYTLILTEVGNPSNILFTSSAQALVAGVTDVFIVTGNGNEGLAAFSVVQLGSGSAILPDSNLQSGIRVLNTAADKSARDIVIDSNFATPLIAALPFATQSNYELVAGGLREITVTPAGNTGVLEIEQTSSVTEGLLYTLLLSSNDNGLATAFSLDNRRSLLNLSTLKILNGAGQFSSLEFFVLPIGMNIDTAVPLASFGAPGVSPGTTILPDSYELVIRDSVTQTTVSGPQTITLGVGGVYGILAVDGADATTADVVLLDDFN